MGRWTMPTIAFDDSKMIRLGGRRRGQRDNRPTIGARRRGGTYPLG